MLLSCCSLLDYCFYQAAVECRFSCEQKPAVTQEKLQCDLKQLQKQQLHREHHAMNCTAITKHPSANNKSQRRRSRSVYSRQIRPLLQHDIYLIINWLRGKWLLTQKNAKNPKINSKPCYRVPVRHFNMLSVLMRAWSWHGLCHRTDANSSTL